MELKTGIKGQACMVADESTAANRTGSGSVEVFSTPSMIALMEEAAQHLVLPYLEEGQSTVGTKISVSHDSATPIGMKVTAEAELTEVDGRRLCFNINAFDEAGPIGKGTHERFIIYTDKFMQKVTAKGKTQN